MKPRLMSTVYYKQNQDIVKGVVYMKGKDTFCFVRNVNAIRPLDECGTSELYYDLYGSVWFTSLRKAKDAVIEEYINDKVDHIEFEKLNDNIYLGYIYDKKMEN